MDPAVDKIKEKEIEEVEQEDVLHYKLTLTHKNSKGLEITTNEVMKKIQTLVRESNANIRNSGVTRLPTKYMHITTRKSPCGNGTNTFDHYEMRLHKRVMHIHCSQKNFQSVVGGLRTEPGMILEADEI